MHNIHRHIYRLLLRLHPPAFRNEFAREMVLDFDEALHTFGLACLLVDAAISLVRQWFAGISTGVPGPAPTFRPSLLAGNYVMVCDSPFTSMQLGFGLIAAATQLALCQFALSASPRHTPNMPTIYASASTTVEDGSGKPEMLSPVSEGSGFEPGPPQSETALLGFAGPAQTSSLKPELLLFHPSGPLPSYEVATIKPLGPDAASRMVRLPPAGSLNPLSIRRYIMDAYGAIYAPQIVGGPTWLNKDTYNIHGKVPEDLAAALQKMNRDNRIDQNRMMQQSLLADRFHLKAHFETRVLPVYELVPAKSGLKITGVPAPPELKPGEPARLDPSERLAPGTMMTTPNSSGLRVLNGRAIKMQLLARIIGGDIGDRPIVDHTGFTGFFDISDLTWAPLAEPDATSEPDAPSLSAALKEKLGVSIVRGEDPIEVLVIDDIGRPTPN